MRKVAPKKRVITVINIWTKITKSAKTEFEKARNSLEQDKIIELIKENTRIIAHKKL